MDGALLNPVLRVFEQCQADAIRSQAICYICENFDQYDGMQGDMVNADMSKEILYTSLLERITELSKATVMPGEFEIIATSKSIQRAIHIMNNNQEHINKYGSKEFNSKSPLTIQHTSLREDVGHYDYIAIQAEGPTASALTPQVDPICTTSPNLVSIPCEESELTPTPPTKALPCPPADPIPVQDSTTPTRKTNGQRRPISVIDISPIPVKVAKVAKRYARASKPEVLTSSPYKDALSAAKDKMKKIKPRDARNTSKRTKGKKNQKKKPKAKAQKETSDGSPANWYCFLCDESNEEDMILCYSCKGWVHTACADLEVGSQYECDMCS